MSRILIIEDDQIVANIYRNKFSVEGYQVEVAHDGEKGFESAKAFQPDAIVLDLMLPGISGVELMKRLRTEPIFEKTPIIVFSNTYLTNLVQDAWKAGATKCLSKANCTPKQVIDVVRGTLGQNATKPATPTRAAGHAPSPAAAPVSAQPNWRSDSDSDVQFQSELRRSFVAGLPGVLTGLRAQLQGLIKAENETVRSRQAHELYRHLHSLAANAGIAGQLLIAQMADALEALLKELYEKPGNMNASTLRTVAAAIDFLDFLFRHGTSPSQQEMPPANILVVDDEVLSRRAVTFALEKARLKSVSVEDPNVAYKLLSENAFDLVVLDVDMPGMNGFELCTRLRGLPNHKTTPVVFVTSLNDFENRANSSVSGGNDFIGKPFLFIELAVKALVYVLKGKIKPAK